MKIVFLTYAFWPPDFGGELRNAIERFESLAQRGHQVVVLTSGQIGYLSKEAKKNITILRSPVIGSTRPARLLRRIMFWLWALFYLLRLQYEILHWLSMPGIGQVSNALCAWSFGFTAHLRKANVVCVHSLADKETLGLDLSGSKKFWKHIYFTHADAIVGVSPVLYNALKQEFTKKAVYLPYGVRDDIFHQIPLTAQRMLRLERGLTDESIIFSFLGSVGYRKGFDTLAEAFGRCLQQYPDWHLWVIGPYSAAESRNLDPDEVKAVCQPLEGSLSQVHFWGRIDDRERLAQLLGTSDVFVFPSRREGMGIALLEAMAVGTPVIVSWLPGITDLANVHNETGLYVAPGDVGGLQDAMLQLGTDRLTRKNMGSVAVDRIRSNFGWQQYIDEWEQLYIQISAGRIYENYLVSSR